MKYSLKQWSAGCLAAVFWPDKKVLRAGVFLMSEI